MITEDGTKLTFEEAIENIINSYSQENGSNTPDFILAKYLYNCLENFNQAVNRREQWYDRQSPTPLDATIEEINQPIQ